MRLKKKQNNQSEGEEFNKTISSVLSWQKFDMKFTFLIFPPKWKLAS